MPSFTSVLASRSFSFPPILSVLSWHIFSTFVSRQKKKKAEEEKKGANAMGTDWFLKQVMGLGCQWSHRWWGTDSGIIKCHYNSAVVCHSASSFLVHFSCCVTVDALIWGFLSITLASGPYFPMLPMWKFSVFTYCFSDVFPASPISPDISTSNLLIYWFILTKSVFGIVRTADRAKMVLLSFLFF